MMFTYLAGAESTSDHPDGTMGINYESPINQSLYGVFAVKKITGTCATGVENPPTHLAHHGGLGRQEACLVWLPYHSRKADGPKMMSFPP